VVRLALFGQAPLAIRFQQWAAGELFPELLTAGRLWPVISAAAARN
jgi:hypothetical protein